MDWWLIPLGLGVAVLLRLLWVAAFHTGDTVTAMPELDGYVPRSPHRKHAVDGRSDHIDAGIDADGAHYRDDCGEDDDGVSGVWIELDVEPLFPSSQRNHVVDLIEESESETSR